MPFALEPQREHEKDRMQEMKEMVEPKKRAPTLGDEMRRQARPESAIAPRRQSFMTARQKRGLAGWMVRNDMQKGKA